MRATAITMGLVVALATGCHGSSAAQGRCTLAATFGDDAWLLIGAREGAPVTFPAGSVIARYDARTRELTTVGFGNWYGMSATERPDGELEWRPGFSTLKLVAPELAAAGDRYTKLVLKTYHARKTASGLALESNDGTTALEYRRLKFP